MPHTRLRFTRNDTARYQLLVLALKEQSPPFPVYANRYTVGSVDIHAE